MERTYAEIFSMVFDWANEMGTKGIKVFGFHVKKVEPTFCCYIECTEEEQKASEKRGDILGYPLSNNNQGEET